MPENITCLTIVCPSVQCLHCTCNPALRLACTLWLLSRRQARVRLQPRARLKYTALFRITRKISAQGVTWVSPVPSLDSDRNLCNTVLHATRGSQTLIFNKVIMLVVTACTDHCARLSRDPALPGICFFVFVFVLFSRCPGAVHQPITYCRW